jgi:hypothetical protein
MRLIYPDGSFYRKWSLMMAVPMTYTAILTPLYIGLLEDTPLTIFILDRIMDVVFITDLVCNVFHCNSESLLWPIRPVDEMTAH